MIIKLETRVPVACHVIHASVDEALEIPYMMPVLMHVKERGGAATAESMSKELSMPLPLCRILLAHCSENGLAEGDGEGKHTLTPDGSLALESGRVFTRTVGMWRVYVADHKAIPEGLRVVRIDDGERDAGYQWYDGPDQPRVEYLDESMQGLVGETLRPALGRVGEAVVREVHRYEKQIKPDLDVKLRIEPEKDAARVALLASPAGGQRHGRRTEVPSRASLPGIDMTIDAAMDSLLDGGRDGVWDAEQGCILVDYDGASDDELSLMQKTVRVERPEVGGMAFESVAVTARILPRSEADARKWARRMFAALAGDYVTREEYRRLAGRIGAKFPGFDIRMGDRAGHIPSEGEGAGARGRTRLFWLLQAMEDWDI